MSDELTDDQISLLCAIGEANPLDLADDRKRDLERLISGGYAEPTESNPESGYRLTARGIAFLGERGAGLNEA